MPRPDRTAAPGPLIAALDDIRARLRASAVLWAAAAGAAAGAVVLLAGVTVGWPRAGVAVVSVALAALVLTVAVFRNRGLWTRAEAARRAERVQPEIKNLVVTAEELLRCPERASSWMRDRIVASAALAIADVRPGSAVRLRRPLTFCLAGIALWIAVAAGVPGRAASLARDATARALETARGASAPQLTIRIAAPAYLGGAVRTLTNPERVEAVAGSRMFASVSADAGMWRLRLGTRQLTPSGGGPGDGVVLAESSYLAVESESSQAARALIPVVVTPDGAPSIRIEQPGKDLLLPDTKRDVAVETTANDDFGLTSLELRFTKVSGSGEQFEFQEGTVPLALDNKDSRAWKGRAALALSRMNLQPGDSLVYRVVGRDGRGESGMASSDSFFIEIAGQGEVTIAGFELPPDRERYALSQQMIVLKIERLRQREKAMAGDALAREAADIAAEQRAVRANFIFLTGGTVEDEEEEAAHSHEIQEGRLAHTARREITAAIQHMSRAEQELVAVSTAAALAAARAAVEALQRAFGRNRYILRSMPVRSRLDPTRRLSADLDEAVDWGRSAPPPSEDSRTMATRALLAAVLDLPDLLSSPAASTVAPSRISALAEDALAIEAGSKNWQQIASSLVRLRDAVAGNRSRDEIQTHLEQAAALLRAEAKKSGVLPAASPAQTTLRSSWAEEARRR